jgi:hypothetical protein
MPIKDHVTKRAKRINSRISKTYNLSITDFEQALFGSSEQMTEACKKIGQVGRESQLVIEMLPQIKEHFLRNIAATTQYNQAKADILKQAGNSLTTIDRAEMSTMLASQQYNNKRSAMAQEFVASKGLEKQRHELEVNYIRLKAIVEQALGRVDGQAKLIEQVNRPQLKQIDENLNHQKSTVQHVLNYGNSEQRELLETKNYLPIAEKARGVFSGLAEKLGIYV